MRAVEGRALVMQAGTNMLDFRADSKLLIARKPFEIDPQAEIVQVLAERLRERGIFLQFEGAPYWMDSALIAGYGIPTPQKNWSDEDFDLIHSVTWTAFVIEHPKFDDPMIVLSTVDLAAPQVNQVVKFRWGIEQPPLVAKQLLGLHRQFVWGPQMRFRYPELSLLAAGILTYAAACVPAPTPTGWWDRHPKPTAGRLRRLLIKVDWRKLPLHPRLREKNAVTAHLPKGRPSLAHRANQNQPLLA